MVSPWVQQEAPRGCPAATCPVMSVVVEGPERTLTFTYGVTAYGSPAAAACAPDAPVSSSPVASAPTPAVANALVLILMVIRSFPVVESGCVPGPGRAAHPVTPEPTLPRRRPGA